jgi:hypothetical protein
MGNGSGGRRLGFARCARAAGLVAWICLCLWGLAANTACDDQIDCGSARSLSLTEYCRTFPCPHQTLADAFQGIRCHPTAEPVSVLLLRIEGCGLVTLVLGGGGATEETFDAKTGALVGASSDGDTTFGPCKLFSYAGGRARTFPSSCGTEIISECTVMPFPDAGPFAGCRAPDEPGCARCCKRSSQECTVYEVPAGRAAGMGVGYQSTSLQIGACDPECPPCARCSRLDEEALLSDPRPPGCTCDSDAGVCIDVTTCACWCARIGTQAKDCPTPP